MSNFRFSSSALAELGQVLNEAGAAADPFIPQLEMLVSDYRAHGDVAGSQTEQTKQIDRETRELFSALRDVLDKINGASPELRKRLSASDFIDRIRGTSTWQHLSELDKEGQDCLQRLQWYVPRPKLGRPVEADRRALALDIATVMMLNGLKIATSRQGTFAAVLAIALTEAYGSAPVDPFRLVKHCSDALKDVTPNELRRMVKLRPPYSFNPTFWQTVGDVLIR